MEVIAFVFDTLRTEVDQMPEITDAMFTHVFSTDGIAYDSLKRNKYATR